MKKFCFLLSAVLFFLMFLGINNTYAAANPMVKIGLYFNSTAQSQIEISGAEGISFNSYDSSANKYFPVYSSEANEVTVIRKDSYFSVSGQKYTPVAVAGNPSSGPYHIQVKSKIAGYGEALALAQGYKQKGIASYPVYTDSGWCVWTGFYISKAAAQSAAANVKTKLGSSEGTIIEQSDSRVYGVNSQGEVMFMYASEKNLLRGKSLSQNSDFVKIGTGKLNSFRGEVEFLRKSGSDMTIINVLHMEEYLYGVVPNEMEAFSNIEALKAQAIAARTYSYKSINKHAANGFNLCSTTDCHVYKGMDSESEVTNKAIDETKDMIVTYNGSIAETLYFSSSGGQTEAAVNVWGTDFPYLQSVEDKYESGNSYKYNWEVSFTIDEISQKLKSKNIGTVTGIEITKYSSAGRPTEIIVRGTSNPEGIKFTNDACRTFLGLYSQWYTINTNSNINVSVNNENISLPLSQVKVVTAAGQTTYTGADQKVTILGADGTSFTVSASPGEYNFTGRGWGHAVGMSQEGAKGMANAGYTYDQILAHYYTGTKIELKQ